MTETLDAAERRVSHYRILHPIGSGGMGDVFLGVDETLKRKVALKAIRAEHRLSDTAKARFLREARILSQLDHPSICRAFDYIEGQESDWLVLEYIEGRSLRDAMKEGLDRGARLRIAEQIAAVLVVTHAAGIVHRDLKPGNVMLTGAGDVKVLDFGLARSGRTDGAPARAAAAARTFAIPVFDDGSTRGEDSTASGDTDATHTAGSGADTDFRTELGSVSGTPAYMSPEQARGETATAASDMFSFGLVLQELFTGDKGYPRDLPVPALIERVQAGATVPPQGVSSDIAALLRGLTAPIPTRRPTALDAAARLRWIREKPTRRLWQLAAAVALLFVIGGSIKYTLDLRRERTAAVLAREDADRRRAQAEDLIGFMIGDLRTKLTQAGRLELLEGVGGKAMTYFASVPAASLTNEELFRRGQAIQQIGLVEQAGGNLAGALTAYRESLRVAEDVAARAPANGEYLLGVGTAHFYVGDALRRQGDLQGAMTEFVAYRDVAKALVNREPAKEKWLLELSYGHGSIAAVQEAQGDLDRARRELEFALAVKADLARRDPASLEKQQSLATGHNRLGVVLDKLGAAAPALQHYRDDLEIRRTLVTREPKNNAIKRNYLVALTHVSVASEDRGDLAAAAEHARQAHEVAAALAALDPRNADWQRDLAIAEGRWAGVLRLTGALAESQSRQQRAIDILRPLATATTNVARQRDLASAFLGDGWTRLARGDVRGAEAASAAVESTIAVPIARKGDLDAVRIAADGRLLGARAAERSRNPARARELRESALLILTSAHSLDPRFLMARARALIALGRHSDAGPVVKQLFAAGYRHPTLVAEWSAAQRNP